MRLMPSWRPNNAEVSKINATYNYFLGRIIWNSHLRVNRPPHSSHLETSTEDLSQVDPELIGLELCHNKQNTVSNHKS